MCGTNTGFLRVLAQVAVDALDQPLEVLAGQVAAPLPYISLSRTAPSWRGVDRFDQVAQGQHDLGAAAADVGHGHVLAVRSKARCTLKNARRASCSA